MDWLQPISQPTFIAPTILPPELFITFVPPSTVIEDKVLILVDLVNEVLR